MSLSTSVHDLRTLIRSCHPLIVVETVEEVDRCFARMRFRGVHTAELLGFPATGRVIEWDGAALFHLRDGVIVDLWVLADRADVFAQLSGTVPPEA